MTVRVDALTAGLVPQQAITYQKLDMTVQFNVIGSFTLILPATERNWQLITFDSAGEFVPVALYVDWNGVFSIPLLAEQWEHDLTVDSSTGIITETITLSGADFGVLLANRVAYVDGTKTWANQPTTPRVITGPAETVIKTLVTENLVTAGDTARRVPNFAVATDQGRGGTVTVTITPPLPTGQANFLSGDAGQFESTLGGWQASANCTVSHTTARAHQSNGSMQVTSSAAGDMTVVSCPAASILTGGFPCRPGDSLTASAWFRASTTTETCNPGADFYDISGTWLSTAYATGASDTNSGWTQVSGTISAPDNAVLCRANVKIQNTNAAGEIHYLDDVQLTDNGGGFTGGRYVASLGQQLMDAVRSVAAQSLIGVSVTLSGSTLVFDCYLPRDLSSKAVFSAALGNLRGDMVSDAVPTADVVLLEDGAEPPNFTVHTAAGNSSTDPWRRVEVFDDQTSTTTATDLTAAYTQDLAAGEGAHQLTVTATDIPLLRFGKDALPVQGYGLGDTVTVVIREGVSYTDIVSAVQLTAGSDTAGSAFTGPATGVQAAGGSGGYYEQVTPTIGNPAFAARGTTVTERLTAQVRKIGKLIAQARKAGQ